MSDHKDMNCTICQRTSCRGRSSCVKKCCHHWMFFSLVSLVEEEWSCMSITQCCWYWGESNWKLTRNQQNNIWRRVWSVWENVWRSCHCRQDQLFQVNCMKLSTRARVILNSLLIVAFYKKSFIKRIFQPFLCVLFCVMRLLLRRWNILGLGGHYHVSHSLLTTFITNTHHCCRKSAKFCKIHKYIFAQLRRGEVWQSQDNDAVFEKINHFTLEGKTSFSVKEEHKVYLILCFNFV